MRRFFVGATCTAFTVALPLAARASEIVEVLPLTDQIVMVHFDDGKVTLAKPGQVAASGDIVTVSALDRARASNADSYSITSAGDAAYATAIGLAFVNQWISDAIYVGVALWWLVPDRRIESRLHEPAAHS